MKSVLRSLALLVSFALLFGLCACGVPQNAPAEPAEEAPSPLSAYAGLYTLFGVSYEDRIVEAEVFDFSGSLLLDADGGGTLQLNGEDGVVSSWTAEGDQLRLQSSLGRFSGTLEKGVAVLSADEKTVLYFAADGADRTAYPTLDGEAFVALIVDEALGDAELPDLDALLPPAEEAEP